MFVRVGLCVQADQPSPNGFELPAHRMWFRVCSKSKVGAKFPEVLNAFNGSVIEFLTSSANAFLVKCILKKIGAKTG